MSLYIHSTRKKSLEKYYRAFQDVLAIDLLINFGIITLTTTNCTETARSI